MTNTNTENTSLTFDGKEWRARVFDGRTGYRGTGATPLDAAVELTSGLVNEMVKLIRVCDELSSKLSTNAPAYASAVRRWKSDPHEWGEGKVHAMIQKLEFGERPRLVCRPNVAELPPGKETGEIFEVNCGSCLHHG